MNIFWSKIEVRKWLPKSTQNVQNALIPRRMTQALVKRQVQLSDVLQGNFVVLRGLFVPRVTSNILHTIELHLEDTFFLPSLFLRL